MRRTNSTQRGTSSGPASLCLCESKPSVIWFISVLLLLHPYSVPAVQIANEYWVSSVAVGTNGGTLQDPYDGSTQALFDARMRQLTTNVNSTIHILPGTYQTVGNVNPGVTGWSLTNGQRLVGSGIDVTILKLVSGAANFSSVVGGGPGTNEEVSDLTVDCNYTSGNFTYHGVTLAGSRHSIRRVKCIHAAGNSTVTNANPESFPIAIAGGKYGFPLANSEGNLIEACEVSQFQGTGPVSAIGFNAASTTNWISGSILNNRVFLPLFVGAEQMAYNCGAGLNVLVHGNYSQGGNSGYFNDTGPYTNITIAHNVFKDCFYGIRIGSAGPVDTVSILGNKIELGSFGTGQGGVVLHPDTGGLLRNALVLGNSVRFVGEAVNPQGWGYTLSVGNISGCTFANNTADKRFRFFYGPNVTNFKAYNNVDFDGNFLNPTEDPRSPQFELSQISPPNGWTRRTTTITPVGLSYSDYYLGVAPNPSAAVDVYLPYATGRSGKVFVIGDEGGNANNFNITIWPSLGETINGAAAVKKITTAYGRLTFISDGAGWFAQ